MLYSKENFFEAITFFYFSGSWHLKSACNSIDFAKIEISLVGINGILLPREINLNDSPIQNHNTFNIHLNFLKEKLNELNYSDITINSQSHPIINLSFKPNGFAQNFRIASRTLSMEKISNFRDMGGYPTIDNRQVIWGKLFRSGHLAELSPNDKSILIEHNVKVVCDFRDRNEFQKLPSQVPVNIKVKPLHVTPASITNLFEKIDKKNISSQELDFIMEKINFELVEDHYEKYKSMFDVLIENDGFGSIIHCSAGKDRTGFGSFLILSALGVPEKIIMEDYLLSNQYIDIDHEINRYRMSRFFKLKKNRKNQSFDKLFDDCNRNILNLLLQVKKSYLQKAIDTINDKYNGIENYLFNVIKLNNEKRQHLKDLYLYTKDRV